MTMLCSCELVIRIPVYDCLITPYMGLLTMVPLGTPPVLTMHSQGQCTLSLTLMVQLTCSLSSVSKCNINMFKINSVCNHYC